MIYALLLFIASTAQAQDTPYYQTSTKSDTDLGALNQNNRDLAARGRNGMTNVLTPSSCPAGQALTGAYYNKSGATTGGTCMSVTQTSTVTGYAFLQSTQTFSGGNTFSGPITISSTVVSNNLIHNSSTIENFSATGSNTTISVCVATRTFVTGNNPARLWYTGGVISNGSGEATMEYFLVDGVLDSTEHSTYATIVENRTTSFANNGSFKWQTSTLSAGQHSICLGFAARPGSGTTWSACASASSLGFGAGSCQFGVEEVK